MKAEMIGLMVAQAVGKKPSRKLQLRIKEIWQALNGTLEPKLDVKPDQSQMQRAISLFFR